MSSTIAFLLFIPLLSLILLTINILFAPHNPYIEKNNAFECGFTSFLGQNRIQFSISFFIFALLFLLFDLEILLVYPYLVSAYVNETYGLLILMIFLGVLTIGFIFELGKKALTIDSKQTNLSNHNSIKKSLLSTIPNTISPILNINENSPFHLMNRSFSSSSISHSQNRISRQSSTIYKDWRKSFSTTNRLELSSVYFQKNKIISNSQIFERQIEARIGKVGSSAKLRDIYLKYMMRQKEYNLSILEKNKVTSKYRLETLRWTYRRSRSVKLSVDRLRDELARKLPRLPKPLLDAKSKGLYRSRQIIGRTPLGVDRLYNEPERIQLPPIHTTRFDVPENGDYAFDSSFVINNPGVLKEDLANRIVRSTGNEWFTPAENDKDMLPPLDTIEPIINSSELIGGNDFPAPILMLACQFIISFDSTKLKSLLFILVKKYKYINYILEQNIKVGPIISIIKNYHTNSIYYNSESNLSKLFKFYLSKYCETIRYYYRK